MEDWICNICGKKFFEYDRVSKEGLKISPCCESLRYSEIAFKTTSNKKYTEPKGSANQQS